MRHATGSMDAGARRLVQAVQDLSRARTVPEVAAVVRTAARDLAGADGATFVLREGDQCSYVDEDAIGPLWKGQRFPMSTCISGWVMAHRIAVVVPDIFADARIPHDLYRPTFVRSLALVPIRSADPLGAIGAYWARPHAPSRAQLEVLQALADTTAVALENAAVYRELESRVARRTAELEAANAELQDFSHTVSHDLRQPLRSLAGFTELLRREHGRRLPEEARGMLDLIAGNAERMDALVAALLEFSVLARRPLQRDRVAMRTLALEVAEEAEAALPAGAGERRVAVGDLPSCQGDPVLLRQVLANLLGNALKFTRGRRDPAVTVSGHRRAGESVYEVADNGIGFDPAKAQRLFEPFQTLHRRADHPGTGIGLSIVQRIVARHGGRVWAEGRPGQGATFRFSIPDEGPATAPRRETGAPGPLGAAGPAPARQGDVKEGGAHEAGGPPA